MASKNNQEDGLIDPRVEAFPPRRKWHGFAEVGLKPTARKIESSAGAVLDSDLLDEELTGGELT